MQFIICFKRKMGKMIAFFVVLIICLIIKSNAVSVSSLLREEQLQKIARMVIPYMKQTPGSNTELDSLYKGDQVETYGLINEPNQNKTFISYKDYEKDLVPNVKRKMDDYGHLRFGRNEKANRLRIKYADPDYGHMRFGR